ncbi:2-hydroxyacyl-CoA dehydratase [Clostridiaceae bacterium 35-E11]
MKKIGLTTTVPIEVLLAAGYTPIDLNNIFVTSDKHLKYIDLAEKDGFPKSMCAWIKGIYGVCLKNDIHEIVGVMEGDCSNTKVLIEILRNRGIKIHPFSFPHRHTKEDVKKEIKKFMEHFNVNEKKVEEMREEINKIREKAKELDQLTYIDDKATGFENHLFQLCASDFDGDVGKYRLLLEKKVEEIKSRKPDRKTLRLGYLGVPPMTEDLFAFVENFHARFIYNEVQREFAFPRADRAKNIYEHYYDYTYPYDMDYRLSEIKKQIEERKIDAIIHYTQAFCHRAAEDIILKQKLDIPILNIEGDKLNKLDARTKLRIEAFLDMLYDLKEDSN